MFDNVELVATKALALSSVGSYTIAKALGVVTTNLNESWHFQLLQELAFAAAIISAGMAILTFHQKWMESRGRTKAKKKHTKNTDDLV